MNFIGRAMIAGAISMLAASGPAPLSYQSGEGMSIFEYPTALAKDGKRKQRSSGLAGSLGTVKSRILVPSSAEGGCGQMYRNYVAAGGHSAFSSTPIDHFYGGEFACGAAMNAPSQAVAESRALASCESAVKTYKARNQSLRFGGKCAINMSK
ncbi:MAG: hypothetical protein WBA44_06605 [Mesorhizobium sp.]